MFDFFPPTTKEGERIRREAQQAAIEQVRHPRTIENTEIVGMDSAVAAAWQLKHGNKQLKVHAANEVIKAIKMYGGANGDPSGTYARLLLRICVILDKDLGDLIQAEQNPECILTVARSRRKKR